MKNAYFILSTGRCGTQWIANHLQQVCGPRFLTVHEPLQNGYQPRKALELNHFAEPKTRLPAPVIEHFHGIHRILKTRHYIECGHPCWSTIPYCIREFAGRVGVIHLVRHPVHTAFSWLTHRAYCPPLLPHLREKILLSPFDQGVIFPAYKKKWKRLSPYEKALFYWAEVNAFGLNLEQQLDIPWLRPTFEDIFKSDGWERLTSFLGMEARENRPFKNRIDNYRWGTDCFCDWKLIDNHPQITALADRFGYRREDVDEARLYERYVMMHQ